MLTLNSFELYYRAKFLLRTGLLVGTILVVSAYIGKAMWTPGNIRTLLGFALIFFVVAVSVRKPNIAMYLIIIYLPLMGLIRRIIIPIAGWGSLDPLVLMGSVTSLLLGSYWFYHRLFLQEPVANDTPIFKLVRLMVLIDMLEVINPRQGSLFVGIGGILFYIVPLFWMVASRQYMTDRWVKRIIYTTFALGIFAALYGLKQTFYGFYPFEEQWLQLSNLTSLHIGKYVRAISTLDNPQEYATYLGIAMVIGWVLILQGKILTRVFALLGSSAIGYALFMESVRTILITTAVSMGVIGILSGGTIKKRIVIGVVTVLVVATGITLLAKMPYSNYSLVGHSIGGLAHPLNSQTSDAQGHAGRMFSGMWSGIKSVIGFGLGSTTTAAAKFASSNGGTEIDISNMFVSDGILGGSVYLFLMISIITKAGITAHKRTSFNLVCLGVIISTAGQWMNGELYSSSTLLWILLGYLDKTSSSIVSNTSQSNRRLSSLLHGSGIYRRITQNNAE